eukprot:9492950-Pyramimonas_sp.AAC.1
MSTRPRSIHSSSSCPVCAFQSSDRGGPPAAETECGTPYRRASSSPPSRCAPRGPATASGGSRPARRTRPASARGQWGRNPRQSRSSGRQGPIGDGVAGRRARGTHGLRLPARSGLQPVTA